MCPKADKGASSGYRVASLFVIEISLLVVGFLCFQGPCTAFVLIFLSFPMRQVWSLELVPEPCLLVLICAMDCNPRVQLIDICMPV